jgi:hypothetical protein
MPTAGTPAPPMVQPGDSLHLPLDAGGEPTVAVPYLQLNIEVTDQQTGKRVNNATIAVDGRVLA